MDAQFGGLDQRKIFTFAEKVYVLCCPIRVCAMQDFCLFSTVPTSSGICKTNSPNESHGYADLFVLTWGWV